MALDSDFYGNVFGHLTGDVLGNVTGDLTGNVTGNVDGNVVGGTVTATSVSAALFESPNGNGILGLYNAKDFGAVGDGVADDSAALLRWAAAVNASVIAAGVVAYLPPGIYNYNQTTNGPLTFSKASLLVMGFSGGWSVAFTPTTTIFLTGTTGNGVAFTSVNQEMRDISIYSTTATTGYAITYASQRQLCGLRRVNVQVTCNGLRLGDNTNLTGANGAGSFFEDLNIAFGSVTNNAGVGVDIQAGNGIFRNVSVTNSAGPWYNSIGFNFRPGASVDTTFFILCQTALCGIGFAFNNPASILIGNVWIETCNFDQCGQYGLAFLAPGAGSKIDRVWVRDAYISAGNTYGTNYPSAAGSRSLGIASGDALYIGPTGTVNGLVFSDTYFLNAGRHGVYIPSGNPSEVTFTNCYAEYNNQGTSSPGGCGYNLASGTYIRIRGGRTGSDSTFGAEGQLYGVYLGSPSNTFQQVTLEGLEFEGNATAPMYFALNSSATSAIGYGWNAPGGSGSAPTINYGFVIRNCPGMEFPYPGDGEPPLSSTAQSYNQYPFDIVLFIVNGTWTVCNVFNAAGVQVNNGIMPGAAAAITIPIKAGWSFIPTYSVEGTFSIQAMS